MVRPNFFLLAAGFSRLRGWFSLPLPTLLDFFSPAHTQQAYTPTHFARRYWRHHRDQCAQWRLPPPLHFYLPSPFFCLVFFYEKTPKWPIFIFILFYNGSQKPRPFPLVKYWRVYCPSKMSLPTTKNGTRKMAAHTTHTFSPSRHATVREGKCTSDNFFFPD